MKHGKIFSKGSLVLALSLTAVLLVTACTSGATATVVQVGNPQAQAPAGATPTDWDTEWSQKIGFKLEQTFDSSGDPAWDPVAHPDVFFTTVGPGYSGLLSENVVLPGLVIIDATTKEIVAYRSYDLGADAYFEPHGLGVSMDGRFIYLPTGVSAGFSDANAGRFLVIDARTLKLHQLISTPTMAHHAKTFLDSEGRERVLIYTFRGQFAILDPNDDNRVVASIDNGDLTASGYLGFVDPSGKYLFITLRGPSGMESEGGVAVVSTETWRVVKNINTHDESPIWVEFTADGKYAYVSGGHGSNFAKIHIEGPPIKWELVGLAQTGTAGPYSISLNWEETEMWAIGKGEGSHNRGFSLGLNDPIRMPPSWGALGEFYTGCIRGDHITLHPDPELNEMWLSCNSSFEVVVWDMEAKEVKARIPMPEGGSTHSGSFVHYNPDFSGEVLSDHNGLHGKTLALRAQIAAQAQAK